jgi:hypothetical protein
VRRARTGEWINSLHSWQLTVYLEACMSPQLRQMQQLQMTIRLRAEIHRA